MSLKIVVLAKQVPDTRNVGKDAMTAEGTVNRAALPAIFNPEDLNALEQALRLKEQNPGSTVGILTMGPPRAAEIIRQGLYRGADTGWLLTDRLFAGADTLATSYALATAIKKIGDVDVVIGGRQAIDGDTAQVGPQVAQKLGLNQVTYAEEILKCEDGKLTIRRQIDGGVETVETPMPVVVTVNGSAAPCRPCNAKLVMKFKRATAPMERTDDMPYKELYAERPYLTLNQWSVADVDGDPQQCNLCVCLPVTVLFMVSGFALVFIYNNLLTSSLLHNGSGHGCTCNIPAYLEGSVTYCDHMVKGNSISGLYIQLFNLNDIPLGNLVLFSACCNNCVHNKAPPIHDCKDFKSHCSSYWLALVADILHLHRAMRHTVV